MIEVAAIERFLTLVKRGSQARSKDIRIDFADAVILASEISALLAMVVKSPSSSDTFKTAIGNVTLDKMDGGSL